MNCNLALKRLMKKRKMTVYRLSKTSGVSESTIRNIFLRGNDPSLSTLEALCSALGVTLSEFFMSEEQECFTLNKEEKELIEAYRASDRREKEFIKRVISPRKD